MQSIPMQFVGDGKGLHRRRGTYPKPCMVKGSRDLGCHSMNLHLTRVNVHDMRNIPVTAMSMPNTEINSAR